MIFDTHHRELRRYVLTALLACVAAAGGYLLMAIPNVEVFTAVLFFAGYALGVGLGITAAALACFLYFGINPQGGLFLPLLAAQFFGSLTAPVAGGIWRKLRLAQPVQPWILALIGLLVTLWFDLLTNLAFPLFVGMDHRGILITLAAGIPYSLIHIGSNSLIFFLILPRLLREFPPYFDI